MTIYITKNIKERYKFEGCEIFIINKNLNIIIDISNNFNVPTEKLYNSQEKK